MDAKHRFPALDHLIALTANGSADRIQPEAAALALHELDRFVAENDRKLSGSPFNPLRWIRWLRTSADARTESKRLRALSLLTNATLDEAQTRLTQLRYHAEQERAYWELHALAGPLAQGEDSRFPHLERLSRARSRELFWKIKWCAADLRCSPEHVLSECGVAVSTTTKFMERLQIQAGRRDEFDKRAPFARKMYFEGLSAEEATHVLSSAGNDEFELSPEEQQTLAAASRRDPKIEAFYDAMEPQDAWRELCVITGRDDLTDEFDSGLRRSVLLYEVSTLRQTEHVKGLCRAAHLSADVPSIPGLHERVGSLGWTHELSPFAAAEIVHSLDECGQTLDRAMHDEMDMEFRGREYERNPLWDPVEERLRERASRAGPNSAPRYDRFESWRLLTTHCGLDHLHSDLRLPAREALARALVRRHPNGLPPELEMRAHSALVDVYDPALHAAARLKLRQRLQMEGAVVDPWRALLMLSRAESFTLLSDLYAMSRAVDRERDAAYFLQYAFRDLGIDDALAQRMAARLYVQAGFAFLYTYLDESYIQKSQVLAEINVEHAKDILGLRNQALDSVTDFVKMLANEDRPANRARVRGVLARDAERERTYDVMKPIDAWFELCKLTGRFDLNDAFATNTRASAASQLDFELRRFGTDPHVAGLRRAACFADELPRVTGLRYRLGLSADASLQDLQTATERLTSAEAADIRAEITAVADDDAFAFGRAMFEALNTEGCHFNVPFEETVRHGRMFRDALTLAVQRGRDLPQPNVRSPRAQALGALRPRDAWAGLLQRLDLVKDPRFAIMSLDARAALAAEILAKRPEGFHDDFEEHLAREALLLPFIRKALDPVASLRERLHMEGAVTDPWRALLMLSRAESVALVSHLYAISRTVNRDANDLIHNAFAELCMDGALAQRMERRLYVQAGFPFLGALPDHLGYMLKPALFAELDAEHAKDVLGLPNQAPFKVVPQVRTLANHLRVREALARNAERQCTYDDMKPIRAWFELCKLTGRFDLVNVFATNSRASAASQLDFELRRFATDPHVAGLRRAACFADKLPRVTALPYRLGLPADASLQDVQIAAEQLTGAEAADIRADVTSVFGRDDALTFGVVIFDALNAEGCYFSLTLEEIERQGGMFRDSLTKAIQRADIEHVPSLQTQTLAALRPLEAWAGLLQRFNLVRDPRFAIMSLDARNALAAEIVAKRPEGFRDHVEAALAREALLLPSIRKAYSERQARIQQAQQPERVAQERPQRRERAHGRER